jgi:hypothetical protein
MDAEMRATITTLAGLVALTAITAQAAPLPPARSAMADLNATPPVELVREGCGPGWHRHHWRDRSGYWHWGHCAPNW